MTVLATAEAAAIIVIAAVFAVRRAGRLADSLAVLPPPPVTPEHVEALTQVFMEVAHHSRYGGKLDEFASAALTWMNQQQRGELEAVRQAGHRAWDIHHREQRGETG